MIYFKISSIIKDSDTTDINTIINTAKTDLVVKIGYTDDNPDIVKNRDFSYKTENPSIIHYKYILGGTKEDEALIHIFLKDYLYTGREWFKLVPEVIKFIESVNTIDDIRNKLSGIKQLIEKDRNYKEKSEVLYKLIPAIIPSSINKFEYYLKYYEISNNLRSLISYSNTYEKDILKLVRELYFNRYEHILNQYEINKCYHDDVFISNYNTLTNFTDKMKFLCQYIKDGNDINNVQFSIDDDVINFYLVLGVEKIESHSYIRIRLDREMSTQINNQTIDPSEVIYSIFKPGFKYSNKFIKSELRNIYTSLGYKKTPKASDLEEWFETRKVNYMENGSKINGIEILKKRYDILS